MGEGASEKLLHLRNDPFSSARRYKEKTCGKAVGYFCCYAPEEIIHAAGALPVRIMGEDRAVSKSGAHLQSYCCSLARTSLDMALEGELDFLDGTVFVHTCDTMQRLSDIWRLDVGYQYHADVVLPVRFDGEAARSYIYLELLSFRKRLEEFLGPIDDDAIFESIKTYNRNRELLARLYDLRRSNPVVFPSDASLWFVTSSALMDKQEHNELLEDILSGVSAAPVEGKGLEKVRLFGVGSVMDQWNFLGMVEDLGGTIVDDDFCNGHRYFDTLAQEDGDPMASMTNRLMDRALCPCKHSSSSRRADDIARRVEQSGAQGVLFFQFKFCEPHAFDYPYLKEALDKKNIPTLHLEIEQGSVSTEQLRTRVEALLETIRG